VSASPPRSFAALHHAGYRPYFLLSSLSMTADSIEHVISYWIIFQKFQSPTLGGVAILTHWLPFLFFSVYVGALADRFEPRRLMQIGMVLFMIASLGWGYLFLTDSLEQWHAVVLLCVHGVAGVFWTPVSQIMIHDIVGREHLQSAVRLMATGRYLGLVLGPAIGSLLMLALGPAWGILVNVVLYFPLFWWLQRTAYGKRDRHAAAAASAEAGGQWAQTRALLRQVSRDRTIVAMIVLAGLASFLVGNAYQAQMPEYAHHLGDSGAGWTYSLLFAADALGALAAGIVLESRGLLQPRPRTAIVLTVLWCLAMIGFAAAGHYLVAFVLLFVAGFLNLGASAMAQTLVQLRAPEHLRGRVIGLFSMASLGLRAFSGLTVGVLGSMIGIHWSLAASAMALAAAAAVLLAFSK
jgi:MFS family permease